MSDGATSTPGDATSSSAAPPVEVAAAELVGPDGTGDGDPFAALGFDISSLLASAQTMQQDMAEAQARAAEQTVEGVAGGGAVRISATGGLEFQSVRIEADAVDPTDVEGLEDLILAALRDTVAKANDLQAEAMGGLDLGGLFGGTP